MSRTSLIALLLAATVASVPAQQRSIDEFFAAFAAEWLRLNPSQAASTRYFTGEEQRQFVRDVEFLQSDQMSERPTDLTGGAASSGITGAGSIW